MFKVKLSKGGLRKTLTVHGATSEDAAKQCAVDAMPEGWKVESCGSSAPTVKNKRQPLKDAV